MITDSSNNENKDEEADEKTLLRRLLSRLDTVESLRARVTHLEKEILIKDENIKRLESELETLKGEKPTMDTLLHNKVDKLVRIFLEVSESQKKTVKLLSRGEKRCKSPKAPSSHLEKHYSPLIAPSGRNPNSDSSNRDEDSWGSSLCLLGDHLWKNFNETADIDNLIKEKFPNLRVSSRQGLNLFGMFDDTRGRILVPLPSDIKVFALSIGTRDLRESGLITLKDGSLEEVRKKNLLLLTKKALILKSIVQKILSSSSPTSVIYVLPPRGHDERVEVHVQWEELVIETLKSIPFPKIKILNLPSIIQKSRSEFNSIEEFKRYWFGINKSTDSTTLAPKGTRKLYDELRKAILSRHPSALGMDKDWPVDFGPPTPEVISFSELCPRCTKQQHRGEQCRAIEKLCKRCGIIGHYAEVHDVINPSFQKIIVEVLGVNIYSMNDEENGVSKRPKL